MANTEHGDELKDRVQSGVADLLAQLKEGKSEHYERWESIASKFHRYSFSNQMLIMFQKPEATHVAGFGTWKKMKKDCNPQAGCGIHILAPRTITVTDPDTHEKVQRIIGFKGTMVFDISDVENAPEIPSFFQKLGDAPSGLYHFIQVQMQNEGCVIKEVKRIAGAFGAEGASYGGYVEVVADNDELNKCAILIHEWMHELLHQSMHKKDKDAYAKLTKRQKELHAEAGTYIIFKALGIEVKHSRDYLLNWQATPETFLAEMTMIMQGVKHILKLLESFEVAEEEVAA